MEARHGILTMHWEEMLTYDKWNMPEDTTYEGHFQLLLEFIEQRNDFWVEYMK